jgi:DNA polymerase zeta
VRLVFLLLDLIVTLDRADLATATSRHQLLPDPEKDELTAVFFCFQNEDDGLPDTTTHRGYHAGYVVIDSPQTQGGRARLEGLPCHVVDSELDLINWVIDSVKTWDPDVLAGWELHNASWGYLAARANEAFSECTAVIHVPYVVLPGQASISRRRYREWSVDVADRRKISTRPHTLRRSRYPAGTSSTSGESAGPRSTSTNTLSRMLCSTCSINGASQHAASTRWQQADPIRIPHYSSASLTALWKSKTPEHAVRVLRYFFTRVVIYCEVVDAAEIITKNAYVELEPGRMKNRLC